jgi:hypothetical protein
VTISKSQNVTEFRISRFEFGFNHGPAWVRDN